MKALLAVLACLLLVFYAGEGLSDNDEICNTWINTKYIDGEKPQILMLNYDGTFEGYKTKSLNDVIQRGVFQVVKKWRDSEKNIFYRIRMDDSLHGTRYMLASVNNKGDKLKFCCRSDKYPDEINENEPSYCNYERES